MNKITKITIHNENMYPMEIKAEDILSLDMLDVHTNAHFVAGHLEEVAECEDFCIAISSRANQILTAPYQDFGTSFNMMDKDHCAVSVEIEYEDGEITEIFLPYLEENGDKYDYNTLMKTRVTECGDMIIVVGANFNISEVCDCPSCHCGSCE